MIERGEYRYVATGLKDDPAFQGVSPAAKLVYVYVTLNLGRTGIGPIYTGTLEVQSGLTSADVELGCAELERAAGTQFELRREGRVFWLVNRLAEEPSYSAANWKHRASVQIHLATLPRSGVVEAFRAHYPQWMIEAKPPKKRHGAPDDSSDGDGRGFDSQSNGYRGPIETPSPSLGPSPSPSRGHGRAPHGAQASAPPSALPTSETATATAAAESRGSGATTGLPPTVLPVEALRFLDRFYPNSSNPARHEDVLRQLEASLLPAGTCLEGKVFVRASDRTHLADGCTVILGREIRHRDSAIYQLLLWLRETWQEYQAAAYKRQLPQGAATPLKARLPEAPGRRRGKLDPIGDVVDALIAADKIPAPSG